MSDMVRTAGAFICAVVTGALLGLLGRLIAQATGSDLLGVLAVWATALLVGFVVAVRWRTR